MPVAVQPQSNPMVARELPLYVESESRMNGETVGPA